MFPKIKLWEFFQVKLEPMVEQFRTLLQSGEFLEGSQTLTLREMKMLMCLVVCFKLSTQEPTLIGARLLVNSN